MNPAELGVKGQMPQLFYCQTPARKKEPLSQNTIWSDVAAGMELDTKSQVNKLAHAVILFTPSSVSFQRNQCKNLDGLYFKNKS